MERDGGRSGATSRDRKGADGAFEWMCGCQLVVGLGGECRVRFLPGAACVLAGGVLDEARA